MANSSIDLEVHVIWKMSLWESIKLRISGVHKSSYLNDFIRLWESDKKEPDYLDEY